MSKSCAEDHGNNIGALRFNFSYYSDAQIFDVLVTVRFALFHQEPGLYVHLLDTKNKILFSFDSISRRYATLESDILPLVNPVWISFSGMLDDSLPRNVNNLNPLIAM